MTEVTPGGTSSRAMRYLHAARNSTRQPATTQRAQHTASYGASTVGTSKQACLVLPRWEQASRQEKERSLWFRARQAGRRYMIAVSGSAWMPSSSAVTCALPQGAPQHSGWVLLPLRVQRYKWPPPAPPPPAHIPPVRVTSHLSGAARNPPCDECLAQPHRLAHAAHHLHACSHMRMCRCMIARVLMPAMHAVALMHVMSASAWLTWAVVGQ